MIFKRSFFRILIRVVLIVILAFGFAYSYFQTDLSITPFMLATFIVIAAIELTWKLQKQERNWASFLLSVQHRDFNRAYEKQTTSNELREAYELITESMEELQSNREAEFRLLQTVLGHVSIAVGCYKENGEVLFTNKAFDAMLNLQGLFHIDRLKKEHPQIHQVMVAKEGSPSEWIDHSNGQKLFAKTESFKLKGKGHKLISLTDIRSSLDAKELESYQKLMKVMTHEIMNSATPILSLIRVVNRKLIKGSELITLDAKDQGNIAVSLNAIEERTAGMLKFVEAYKQINRPISPHLEQVESKDLLASITSLMIPETKTDLRMVDEMQDTLLIDRTLISQVVINLITNALQAVEEVEKPSVVVTIANEGKGVHIEVEDNGPGVAPNAIHQIFVPFYTTKPEGSGIGLALSRNIIKAHGGLLEYNRVNDKSRFTVRLPESP